MKTYKKTMVTRIAKSVFRIIILYLIFFAPAGNLLANLSEPVHLFGKVINRETGRPLPGAEVFVPSLQIGSVTDQNGEYDIRVHKRGKFKVICRFIGFQEIVIEISLTEQRTKHDFSLVPRALEMDEIVVRGDREPGIDLTIASQSVTILSDQKLEQIRGQTLGETVAELPGVTTLQTGPSISKPVIRGVHSQRVVIANAGVQQEGQQWGAEHAPEIDPFAPARIEVLKGAASVQYGAGAIGGVIRVEPRDLRETGGVGGQATINAFSNNSQGAGSLLLEGGFGSVPGFGWRTQGSFRRAGDSRAPKHIIRNSGFDERNWSVAAGYSKFRTGLELHFSHFGTELGIFRGAHIGNLSDLLAAIERGEPAVDADFTYDIRAPKQQISHNLFSLHSDTHLGKVGVLELQYGWQQNQRQEFDAHRRFSSEPPTDPAFDLVLTTHSADLTFQHDPVGNVFGKIGVSGMRQGNVRKSTGFLIPNFRAYSGGVFMIENWIYKNWTVNLGARYDYRWMKVFAVPSKNIPEAVLKYSNVTGVLGLIWQFAENWSIGTNLGTAWRPPSVNELFSDGVHHGTAQYELGDPNLKRERSLSLDATLRHAGSWARGEISVFNNRFDDFIFLLPEEEFALTIRGAFPAFSYRQADARLRGVDGSFTFDLNSKIHLDLSGSVIRGDNLETNEPLFLLPSDRFKAGVQVDLPNLGALQSNSVEIGGAFVTRQNRYPEGVDYTDPPDGYNLFDFNLTSKLQIGTQELNLRFSVNNIFNTRYRDYLSRFRYFIDDPGRNVILRINAPFGKFN